MTKIQRFEPCEEISGLMLYDDDGGYIDWDDHEIVVKSLEMKIAELTSELNWIHTATVAHGGG